MNVVPFEKYHEAKKRARAKAKEAIGYLDDTTCGRCVFLPPGVDPFAENLEDEITKVLYRSKILESTG